MSGPELPFHSGIATDFRLDETEIERRVLAERVRVFNDRAVGGAITSPLGTLLLALVLGPYAGWHLAVAWLALINLCELAIIAVGYGFRSAQPEGDDCRVWARRQIAANALAGLAWGSSVWFFRVDGQFELYLINLVVLVGVSALCQIIMSPFRSAMALFALAVLAPTVLQVALLDIPHAGAIAAGFAILFVLEMQYARVAREQLVAGLEGAERSRALVEQLARARAELDLRNCEMEAHNRDLGSALERVRELATRDDLTGAYNRRHIVGELERQVAMSRRHGMPASIVMLDLDHFKRINDRYGHAVGDKALQETVRTVADALREGDVLARFGGEEFLLLLPQTTGDAAQLLAERLRGAMKGIVLNGGFEEVYLRASFGLAQLQPEESVAAWIRRADMALYQAKERGRDCVVAAE